MSKKSKKIKPVKFNDSDLESRPVRKPLPGAHALRPLAAFKQYGNPLTIRTDPGGKQRAPQVRSYRCTAAWKVENSPERLAEFQELSERLGNVHRFYHGTVSQNITAIAEEGLRPGRSGCMFGSGIYLGCAAKAWSYAGERWNYLQEVKYLLEVQAILGKVLECQHAKSHSLKEITAAGYNSVAGVGGVTASWGGTLRYGENVIYSPDQVLVTAVYEYQPTMEEHYTIPKIRSGKCAILLEDTTVTMGKSTGYSPAWADILRTKQCGETAVVEVKTDLGNYWVCNKCIARLRLKVGSTIPVNNLNRWKRRATNKAKIVFVYGQD